VLPARAGPGACAPEFALVSLGWAVCVAGGVLLPPAGLSRCAVALARPLLLLAGGSCRTLRVRVACELTSDFACDFTLLPDEVELDFSSSRFTRDPVDGLTGGADSYFPLSLTRPRSNDPDGAHLIPLASRRSVRSWGVGTSRVLVV
jgi:hypothetical protein